MITKNITVCFIGGDERHKYAALYLANILKTNVTGSIFIGAEHPNINRFENPIKAAHEANVIILPMPASDSEKIIPFDELIKQIKASTTRPYILGGRFSPYLKGILEENKIKYTDYYDNECFTLRNAFLTAEGAISLAMSATEHSLKDAACAIMGYGRIGMALGNMLKAFNADVTVWARREESLTLAMENGLKAKKLSPSTSTIAQNSTIIFNTVPERIFSNEALLSMSPQTVLIELASLPGGFDPDIASQCEIKLINGRGLPPKYAPRSAGKILADTIIQHINQEGII